MVKLSAIFALCVVSCLPFTPVSAAMDDGATNSQYPQDNYKMHICAFHIAKDNPKVVIETQHDCMGLRDDLFQCLLFETTTSQATPKLLGVEYVISDAQYQKLSEQEKKLWHPHNFEVRQGLLALIDVSKKEDQDAMKLLVNTWGKTWHTWPDPTTEVPLGVPRLMWSAEKQGDVPKAMIEARDQRWKVNTAELKEERSKYLK